MSGLMKTKKKKLDKTGRNLFQKPTRGSKNIKAPAGPSISPEFDHHISGT